MQAPQLFDNHNRPINYLRLAVTDRCNLRCFYCMPERGINYVPQGDLLSFGEIERLIRLLSGMGITKVRLTGGEPFVRRDVMDIARSIVTVPGIRDIHITTNGILAEPHIPELRSLGVASVNLSLDTLDRERFCAITRRDEFFRVWSAFEKLIENKIPVKINAVVMDGKNTDDILPLAALTKKIPVSVRFIEEMPFNGEGNFYPLLRWTYSRILDVIRERYPALEKIADAENSTAYHYQVPGHAGTIGVIAGFSRTFCGTCNRIRITAQGILKTCLYDDGVLNIRHLFRAGATDDVIRQKLLTAFASRPANGFDAENTRTLGSPMESMSTIGG